MRKPAKLRIPYMPDLDEKNFPEIISQLEIKGVHASIDNVNWAKSYPYHPLTVVSAAHNGRYLIIEFFVRCNYLKAECYTNYSAVAGDSCVEFFVSPTMDNHYWNFELNCIGTINASHRSERHKPTRLTDSELERILRYSSVGTRPFSEVEGLFAWSVVVAIPLDLIGVEFKGEPIEMSANFNKCASGTSQPHFISWSPIQTPEPDFHQPDFFGKILLLN